MDANNQINNSNSPSGNLTSSSANVSLINKKKSPKLSLKKDKK
jgi:hypothetical protein